MAKFLTSDTGKSNYRLVDWIKLRILRHIFQNDGLFNSTNHIKWLTRTIHPLIESYQSNLSRLKLNHLILLDKQMEFTN